MPSPSPDWRAGLPGGRLAVLERPGMGKGRDDSEMLDSAGEYASPGLAARGEYSDVFDTVAERCEGVYGERVAIGGESYEPGG